MDGWVGGLRAVMVVCGVVGEYWEKGWANWREMGGWCVGWWCTAKGARLWMWLRLLFAAVAMLLAMSNWWVVNGRWLLGWVGWLVGLLACGRVWQAGKWGGGLCW